MMISSIDPATGIFCNYTRLTVTSFRTTVIKAVIALGSHAGNVALVPKIKFTSPATESVSPFDFTRSQFSVRLAFSMALNKAQGQTLDSAGLYLPRHVFGHGQLYVALLRARSSEGIKTVAKQR